MEVLFVILIDPTEMNDFEEEAVDEVLYQRDLACGVTVDAPLAPIDWDSPIAAERAADG